MVLIKHLCVIFGQVFLKRSNMNKKFLDLLKDKTKDFGLSAKAIEDLAEQGSEGITEETSDEDIEKQADFMARIAKSMQGEVTRKLQGKQPKQDTNGDDTKGGDAKGGEGGKGSEGEPDWFKAYREQMDAKFKEITDENNRIKADQAKNERKATIDATAKRLGIPAYLVKRISIADDADIEKELTDLKQELVNEKLLPADAGGDKGSEAGLIKTEADEWAKSLPDKD